MGGVRPDFRGEGSGGFLNPASMGSTGPPVFYMDYSGEEPSEIKGAAEIRLIRRLNISVLAGRRDNDMKIYGAGLAGRILSGTPDTYLNIGASAKIITGAGQSYQCMQCGEEDKDRGEAGTGSIGAIFRPFPSFSLRYIGQFPFDSRYEEALSVKGNIHRAGMSFYISSGVLISLEREYREDGTKANHYGFNLQTGLPLEIMTGYFDGSVSAGIRASWNSFRSSIVFSERDESNIHTRVSLEYVPEGNDRGYR